MAEPIGTIGSTVEIDALHSVDIVKNNSLRMSLSDQGTNVMRKAVKLAKSMVLSFNNNEVPTAFKESEAPRMLAYLNDASIELKSEYLTELQGKIFLWLDALSNDAYLNLVNFLNLKTVTIDSRILIAFISALMVPRLCRALKTAMFRAKEKSILLESDLQFMIYNGIICTPKFKDFMIRLDKSEELKHINNLLAENQQLKERVEHNYKESSDMIALQKSEIEKLRKNSYEIRRILGYGVAGISVLLITYQVGKFLRDIKLASIEEKIDIRSKLRKSERFHARDKEISDLKDSVNILKSHIDKINVKKKDIIVNENLIKIIFMRFSFIFR